MKKLGFIGGGNMAEALAHGLIVHKVFKPSDLIASDVAAARRSHLKRKLKISVTADNLEVIKHSRTILFAVKPQMLNGVLESIAAALGPNPKHHRFISIAAGVPIARMCEYLGPRARVIRVMPNAPAMVGEGMAAIVRSRGASKSDEAAALKIFNSVGDAIALSDETQLDAVTALSGSGPAYVYLFAKAMIDAAVSEGIPRALAAAMTLKTIRGAETMMRSSKLDAGALIKVVASPGGTTVAALRRFAEAGFSDIVARAIHAAADRSRELGRAR
ncbi:MAG TPA: pyrroline-5-carboxylate reductase [Candidatus Binataceae bacterium]|nr:pyrroline-5-carboxylate reductase [Candidatus Binataceae bacterium]